MYVGGVFESSQRADFKTPIGCQIWSRFHIHCCTIFFGQKLLKIRLFSDLFIWLILTTCGPNSDFFQTLKSRFWSEKSDQCTRSADGAQGWNLEENGWNNFRRICLILYTISPTIKKIRWHFSIFLLWYFSFHLLFCSGVSESYIRAS